MSAVTALKRRATPSASKQRLRLWIRILRTARAIEAEVRERLRTQFGVTLPQFDVMAALERRPDGMTMTELSRFLMVSNGNVTGLVDRLAEQKLIERRPSPIDRRAMLVNLTAEGRKAFRAMARTHEGWIAEIFGELSRGEIDELMRLLAKTKAAARRAKQGGDAR